MAALRIFRENKWESFPLRDIQLVASVKRARELNSYFFSHLLERVRFEKTRRSDLWSVYDSYFRFLVNYVELEDFLKRNRDIEKIEVLGLKENHVNIIKVWAQTYGIEFKSKGRKNYGKKWARSIVLLPILTLYSLFSVFFIAFFPRKILIWTGDFYKKGLCYDPRWGDFFHNLEKKGLYYFGLIRVSNQSFKEVLKNLYIRKRLGIYYQSLWDMALPWANLRQIYTFNSFDLRDEDRFLLNLYKLFWPQLRSYRWIEIFLFFSFKWMRPKKIFLFSYTSRTAPILSAARRAGIPTVGIMHGVTTLVHMGHEYQSEYQGAPIGPDKYGVWSSYWQKRYEMYAKIYPANAIEVAGPLRPFKRTKEDFARPKKRERIKILFIEEQELDAVEVAPYLKELATDFEIDLTYKLRPFGEDKAYKALKKDYPQLAQELNITRAPIVDALHDIDVVIGSHSTAVLEASLCAVPFIYFATLKWGDLFEMAHRTEAPYTLYAKNPHELLKIIKMGEWRGQEKFLKCIAQEFFGDKNGQDWLMNQC